MPSVVSRRKTGPGVDVMSPEYRAYLDASSKRFGVKLDVGLAHDQRRMAADLDSNVRQIVRQMDRGIER